MKNLKFKDYLNCFWLFFSLLITQTSIALELNQASVRQLGLNSDKIKSLQIDLQKLKLNTKDLSSTLEPVLSLESGLDQSQFKTFSNTQNLKDTYQKNTLTLSKNYDFGLKAAFEYQLNRANFDFASTTTTLPSSQFQNIFGITLQQPLWQNSLGERTKSQFNQADVEVIRKQTILEQDVETLQIQNLKIFWSAYQSEKNLALAEEQYSRYLKLTEKTRVKKRLGYTSSGELPQVEAELLSKAQDLKQKKVIHQTNLNSLIDSLELIQKKSDLKLNPKFLDLNQKAKTVIDKSINPESTLDYKNQLLKVSSLENNLIATESKNKPQLDLIAKYYQSGIDPSFSESLNQARTAQFPRSYVGILFSYNFGSDRIQTEEAIARQSLEIEKNNTQKLAQKINNNIDQMKLNIKNLLDDYTQITLQKKLREQAANEIEKSYNQGRSDISLYIDSLNKLSLVTNSELTAYSQLEIAILEFENYIR